MTAADRPSVTDNARAEAWDKGWHAGYTDRHLERVGSDGYMIRREPTPNPYRAAARAETTTADVRAECGCDLSVGPNALHIVDGHDGAAARAETTTAYEPCVIGVGGHCTRWSHNHSAETATDNLGDAYMLGYSAAAQRAEVTTEATERIARQIAATTAMTGTDAREYVEAVQALQHAETTTATTEHAAQIIEDVIHHWDSEAVVPLRIAIADALDSRGLLAHPLPDRDQIAKRLFATPATHGAAYTALEIYRLCQDAADAVLDLLRGGGDDR